MFTDKKKQLVTNFSLVFNSEHGKNVLADLRKKCLLIDRGMLQVNPKMDVNKAMYLEGQRSVLLYIFKMLNIDPYAERGGRNQPESNV